MFLHEKSLSQKTETIGNTILPKTSYSNRMDKTLTPKQAIEVQKKLRQKIRLIPLKKTPKIFAGCDVSMNLFADYGFAGFVILDEYFKKIEESVVKEKINFPYIPGLLSFREIPMLLHAWEKLKKNSKNLPDVLIVDGVGIAHPRRMGIATHLGLILKIPTIGCAKNILTGEYLEPENESGAVSLIYDKYDKKEILGAAIRSKKDVKPIFISPGNLITLTESIEIIKKSILKHRLPEPTRIAHNTVNEYRTGKKLC